MQLSTNTQAQQVVLRALAFLIAVFGTVIYVVYSTSYTDAAIKKRKEKEASEAIGECKGFKR